MGRLTDEGSMAFIRLGECECNDCKHVFDNGYSCEAYPEKIPSDILTGQALHRTPYDGDNGIKFEDREE